MSPFPHRGDADPESISCHWFSNVLIPVDVARMLVVAWLLHTVNLSVSEVLRWLVTTAGIRAQSNGSPSGCLLGSP